jgi:hypothetical protein
MAMATTTKKAVARRVYGFHLMIVVSRRVTGSADRNHGVRQLQGDLPADQA